LGTACGRRRSPSLSEVGPAREGTPGAADRDSLRGEAREAALGGGVRFARASSGGLANRSGSPERIATQRSPPCVATSSRQEVSEPYRVGAKLPRRAIDAGGAEPRAQKVHGTAPGPRRLDWLQFGGAIAKASPVLGEAGASHLLERLASHPPQDAALVGDHGLGRRGSDDARSCSRIVASVAEVDERRAAHRGLG